MLVFGVGFSAWAIVIALFVLCKGAGVHSAGAQLRPRDLDKRFNPELDRRSARRRRGVPRGATRIQPLQRSRYCSRAAGVRIPLGRNSICYAGAPQPARLALLTRAHKVIQALLDELRERRVSKHGVEPGLARAVELRVHGRALGHILFCISGAALSRERVMMRALQFIIPLLAQLAPLLLGVLGGVGGGHVGGGHVFGLGVVLRFLPGCGHVFDLGVVFPLWAGRGQAQAQAP
jgi:hypothetical protein